jgi:hypothetical protein
MELFQDQHLPKQGFFCIVYIIPTNEEAKA